MFFLFSHAENMEDAPEEEAIAYEDTDSLLLLSFPSSTYTQRDPAQGGKRVNVSFDPSYPSLTGTFLNYLVRDHEDRRHYCSLSDRIIRVDPIGTCEF
jgi:hypothetical protein